MSESTEKTAAMIAAMTANFESLAVNTELAQWGIQLMKAVKQTERNEILIDMLCGKIQSLLSQEDQVCAKAQDANQALEDMTRPGPPE